MSISKPTRFGRSPHLRVRGYAELPLETNTQTNPDFHVHTFEAELQAADAGQSHSFSVSGAALAGSIGCAVFLDALTGGSAEDATQTFTTNAAANTNLVAPDITPATQPHMEVTSAASFAGPTIWTVPSGMAYAYTSDTTGLAYLRRTTTVAPGTRTHVVNNSGRWIANHGLIKEATGGAPPAATPPPMRAMRGAGI